jgi:H+/Cl- antiporter ClcA
MQIFTILACLAGGLIVGLVLHIMGDHSAIFAELMAEFAKTGRIDYRQAISIVLAAFPSLIFGGSLGPEAPLAATTGGMGAWLAERLNYDTNKKASLTFSGFSGMLGAFITSPLSGEILAMESSIGGSSASSAMLIPGLVASSTATITFVMLSGSYFGGLYTFPDYYPKFIDLIYAVPLGLIGGLAGALFIILFRGMRKAAKPIEKSIFAKTVLGGLVLGIIGAFMPLVLFSGETQTEELILNGAEMGVIVLIALALAKVFVTNICLTAGWKGGYIFPIMFAGAALGMAAHNIFPFIPLAVAVSTTMGGAMVAVMKAPIFSILFVLILVQKEAAPAITIAVISSFIATLPLRMLQMSKGNIDQEKSINEPE